jgi:hypothetical protein
MYSSRVNEAERTGCPSPGSACGKVQRSGRAIADETHAGIQKNATVPARNSWKGVVSKWLKNVQTLYVSFTVILINDISFDNRG